MNSCDASAVIPKSARACAHSSSTAPASSPARRRARNSSSRTATLDAKYLTGTFRAGQPQRKEIKIEVAHPLSGRENRLEIAMHIPEGRPKGTNRRK